MLILFQNLLISSFIYKVIIFGINRLKKYKERVNSNLKFKIIHKIFNLTLLLKLIIID
jgi:hypothetical protein